MTTTLEKSCPRSTSRSRSSNSLWREWILVPAAAAALAAAVAGCTAAPADPAPSGTRIVRLVASNFAFQPEHIEVQRGELVRFVLENPSDLPHEMFIGSADEQAQHNRAHRSAGPGVLEVAADGRAAVVVRANGTAQLEYRFGEPGVTVIGCHLIGHWESGMRAEVVILPDPR